MKIVAHQERGNKTLWIGKEMRFIQGISNPAVEDYMQVNFAGQMFLSCPETHTLYTGLCLASELFNGTNS